MQSDLALQLEQYRAINTLFLWVLCFFQDKEADTQLEADLTSAVARLTLEGENREQIPLVSQTATPNNTPFDVTPLKTPNPEPEDDGTEDRDQVEIDMKRISNSSSVELVLQPENEECQDEHAEKYIKTTLASFELKPGVYYTEICCRSSIGLAFDQSRQCKKI